MSLSSPSPRNPNYPHEFSRKAPEFAAPWPDFVPGADGETYKEFSALLPNRRGLKRADCSFWSKYIGSLKAPAGRGAWSRWARRRAGGWSMLDISCVRCALAEHAGATRPLGGRPHSGLP